MRSALAYHPRRFHYSDDRRYLTAGQVRERYGVSAMWIVRYMRDHGFPHPIKFGGRKSARHWLLADIEAWEATRAGLNAGGAQ